MWLLTNGEQGFYPVRERSRLISEFKRLVEQVMLSDTFVFYPSTLVCMLLICREHSLFAICASSSVFFIHSMFTDNFIRYWSSFFNSQPAGYDHKQLSTGSGHISQSHFTRSGLFRGNKSGTRAVVPEMADYFYVARWPSCASNEGWSSLSCG